MATPLTKVLSVCLLGAACIAQASYPETTPNADTTAATQSTDVSALTSAIATSLDARDRRRGVEDLRPFYKARDYQSLWVATSFGRDRLRVLTRTVTDAQTEGLHPERYLLSSGVSASRSTDPEALARLHREIELTLPDFLSDLETLVNIESGSYTKAGVDQIATWMAARLEAIEATVERHANEELGDMLVATFEGRYVVHRLDVFSDDSE